MNIISKPLYHHSIITLCINYLSQCLLEWRDKLTKTLVYRSGGHEFESCHRQCYTLCIVALSTQISCVYFCGC